MHDPTLPSADDELFDTKMAAAYLGISAKSLERYRFQGFPKIPFIKFSDRRNSPVRYRKSDLQNFARSATRSSTAEYTR